MKRLDFITQTAILSSVVALDGMSVFAAQNDFQTKKTLSMDQQHPNLKLINAFFTAYSNNDSEGIKKVLHPNIKWHIPGNHPLSGTKTGIASVMEYFEQLTKGNFKAEPIVMGVNDTHVIDCHRNWSNLPDSENLDNMSCLLWRIENNIIVEVHNFPENQQLVDVFFNKHYSE